MAQKNGDFGTVTYNNGTINVAAQPNSLGELTMTSDTGDLIQCFWDGAQWVCNSITFKNAFEPRSLAAGVKTSNKTAAKRSSSKSRKK